MVQSSVQETAPISADFIELMEVKFHALSVCARIAAGRLYNVFWRPVCLLYAIITATNVSSVPMINASASAACTGY